MVRSLTLVAVLVTCLPAIADQCGSQPIYHRAQTYTNNYVAQPTYRQTEYQPQIINQTIFYEVGRDVRYPTVTPQAVVTAEMGQLRREAQRIQDKMAEMIQYQQQIAQPQPQIVYVPMVAQPTPATQPQPQPTPAAPQTPSPPQPATPGLQPIPQQPQPQQPTDNKPTFSMTQGIIQQKCVKCHGGSGNPKGDLDLRSTITCAQFHSAMDRLLTDDPATRMPFKQPALTPEETAQAMKELLAMTRLEVQANLTKKQFADTVAALVDPTKAK